MREKRAAARWLEAQRIPERVRVDRDEHEAVFTGKVPRRRLSHLAGGGEMDEAVGKIDGCAVEPAGTLRLAPERARADLVDQVRHVHPRIEGEAAAASALSPQPERPYVRAGSGIACVVSSPLQCLLPPPRPAAAGDSGEVGRYAFVPAESGVFRLDTETGEVSLCMERNGTLVCLRAPGQMAGGPARDSDSSAALEARIAALEAGSSAAHTRRHDEALGRVKTLAERMLGRVVALVREIKGASARENL